MIKVDTKELDKFCVTLTTISADSEKKIRNVIKNSAMTIEKNAKSNLTSNKSVKTGHLRRGIATDIGNMEATIHT